MSDSGLFDAVFLGTSPGMLMEAHLAAAGGSKVAVVDSAINVGGAWRSENLFEHSSLECGPHFFQSEFDFEAVSKRYDFELVDVGKPRWVIKYKNVNLRLSDKLAKTLLLFRYLLKALRGVARKSEAVEAARYTFLSSLGILMRHLFGYKESKVYFKNGAQSLITSVYKQCVSEGVKFYVGEVNFINYSYQAVLLKGEFGEIYTKKVLLTQRSRNFNVQDEPNLWMQKSVSLFRNQVYLVVETGGAEIPYLFRFAGSEYFALTNLNKISNYSSKNQFQCLVLTKITQNEVVPSVIDVEQVVEDLKALSILPIATKVIDSAVRTYNDSRLEENCLKDLVNKSNGRIELVGDIDFIEWLKVLEKKWVSH